ncbi:hypothetical protein RESH_00921 [Rhodopirellula europaea SH398]|uniref:Uncharacterized protein n=1 Tax=Rhodopirellula europaea SH398 TaxID=1263868 RepID=M5SAC9_9BACT|nr:hypothetical protein RESH_00921 [Rhodopirellula europaea SH398]
MSKLKNVLLLDPAQSIPASPTRENETREDAISSTHLGSYQ